MREEIEDKIYNLFDTHLAFCNCLKPCLCPCLTCEICELYAWRCLQRYEAHYVSCHKFLLRGYLPAFDVNIPTKLAMTPTSAPNSMAVNLSMLRPGSVESSGDRKLRTADEVAITSFNASLLCVECSGPANSREAEYLLLAQVTSSASMQSNKALPIPFRKSGVLDQSCEGYSTLVEIHFM